MNKVLNRLRLWALAKLFNDDEKYLICRALEDRCESLERIAINELWANKEDIALDVKDYKKLNKIFSTKEYN